MAIVLHYRSATASLGGAGCLDFSGAVAGERVLTQSGVEVTTKDGRSSKVSAFTAGASKSRCGSEQTTPSEAPP